MVFSSPDFLFFFLSAVLLVYFTVPSFWRNPVLLLFSLLFYGWGEPFYIILMVITVLVDYAGGILVSKYLPVSRKKAKAAMIGAIVINLAFLGFFKYWDFFAGALSQITGIPDIPKFGLALPVGISFYTFQSLSYVIDVYRGDGNVQKNPLTFGTYVTFFPQLIAGPIVRYCDIDDQLRQREHSTFMFASGVRTFICGLAKKLIFANSAGAMWDSLREGVAATPNVIGAWLGILFFTFQIYFDFSGYSDMAIGLGKMFGFRFRENFHYPYIAESITDFWRRWHISLSVWFKEYVYIPLGGNRGGKARTILNLFIVWLLTGLWHGAGWNFILWGLYYGILLFLEKIVLKNLMPKIPIWIRRAVTFLLVMFGWLLFVSAEDAGGLSFMTSYLKSMFASPLVGAGSLFDLVRSIVFILILALASTPVPLNIFRKMYMSKFGRYTIAVLAILIMIVAVAFMVSSSYNPFLYFRF